MSITKYATFMVVVEFEGEDEEAVARNVDIFERHIGDDDCLFENGCEGFRGATVMKHEGSAPSNDWYGRFENGEVFIFDEVDAAERK